MKKVKEVLKAMVEIYDKKMSDASIIIFLSDLKGYTENELLYALQKCRKELKFFPSISEILARIPGSFPGPEEAWAKCPKNDKESVVWTDEIRKAYLIADDLIYQGDLVAARMAFIEKYKQLVLEARDQNKRPVWSVSLGDDKTKREQALLEVKKLNALNCENKKQLKNIELEKIEYKPKVKEIIGGF